VIRVPNGCPQIISQEKFDAVQRILDDRVHRSHGKAIDDYVLSNRIFCGECGEIYRGDRNRSEYEKSVYRNFYKCGRKPVKDENSIACTNHATGRDEVERFVLDRIRELLLHSDQKPNIIQIFNESRRERIGNGDGVIKKLETDTDIAIADKDIGSAANDYIKTDSEIMKKVLEDKIEKLTAHKEDLLRRKEQEKSEQLEIKFDIKLFHLAIAKLYRCLDADLRSELSTRNK